MSYKKFIKQFQILQKNNSNSDIKTSERPKNIKKSDDSLLEIIENKKQNIYN